MKWEALLTVGGLLAVVLTIILACPDVRFDYLDPAYSGREVSQLPDGVIVHQSAHSAQRRSARGAVGRFLREIERRFLRTGRTSRGKTALSQVLKPM
jgi:hypothetical protein